MGAITIPILPSPDFDATAGFWAGFGFVEIGRWDRDYLIVRHEDLAVELHFWHDSTVDRWTNDVACYVRFDTPDEAVASHAGWTGVAVPEVGFERAGVPAYAAAVSASRRAYTRVRRPRPSRAPPHPVCGASRPHPQRRR